MNDAPQSSKSQTALLLGIMAAIVVLIGCAGVGAAYFLGFLGNDGAAASTPAPSTPASMPMPGQQVAGTAPDAGLLPGETLVTAPPPPIAPKVMAPAPVTPVAPAPRPKATWTPPPPPPPAPPVHGETARARIVPPPLPHDYCVNCGVITAIAQRGDAWDVNVKFEDGSSQTLRYPEEPRFMVNQHVHLEDGRLVKD